MKKWWILFVLAACGPSKEDTTMSQAAAIHNEATEIGHRTSMGVSQLKSLEARLNQPQKDSLNAIMTDLSDWYESLVEVPGHDHGEHGHDHDGHDHEAHDHEGHDHEGHDHNHGNEQNYLEGLPASEVLAIQAALKKEIEWMEARVINLLNDVRASDQSE